MKVEIEKHTTVDKNFGFYTKHLALYVDYDDVNHPEVDAAVEVLKEIIEKNWNEDSFKEKFKEKVLNRWNENKYNLQSDFESLEEYLENNGIR
jgi:predicted RND superfamily exporter protein